MCKECGCGDAASGGAPRVRGHGSVPHGHDHSHGDGHSHSHPHEHSHEDGAARTVVLERRLLDRNDLAAAENRRWLAERGVVALNVIGSPGAGKTLLLERTLERLQGRVGCAVVTGDQCTDHDARRLAGKGAEVRQIETHDACHLDAQRVGRFLPELVHGPVRLLFIENVGNLVCPAAFDLGENFKVAVLSAAEGEDKPVKYPSLFAAAPVTVLTKMDLAPHLDWDVRRCRAFLNQVHPGVFVFELSAKSGQGMDAWVEYLVRLVG
jgi:hydrogenase nickel incorporation protein HypB